MLFQTLFLLLSLYFIFNGILIAIWLKNKNFKPTKPTSLPFVSVIIPVRNEAKNILLLLQDLEKQTLSRQSFEVIIADDDSTDETLEIVKKFQEFASINLIINQLERTTVNISPKKRAIDSSIKLASGQFITTTDGDCRVGEKWLETIINFQSNTNAYLISGAVTFFSEKEENANVTNKIFSRIFNKIQTIEFASLVGSGACSMLVQKPNMCNGANLTYSKSVFYEVGGFSGNENLASGDDEFLMHKIAKKYPKKVRFLKNEDAIVETQAHHSLVSFYNQRKRWGSKWKYYDDWRVSALAVFIFLSNFSWLLAFGLWFFNSISLFQFCIISFTKFSMEFVFLSLILKFLRKINLILYIPFVQIIYPIYVVFFGLISQKSGKYTWKGRVLK